MGSWHEGARRWDLEHREKRLAWTKELNYCKTGMLLGGHRCWISFNTATMISVSWPSFQAWGSERSYNFLPKSGCLEAIELECRSVLNSICLCSFHHMTLWDSEKDVDKSISGKMRSWNFERLSLNMIILFVQFSCTAGISGNLISRIPFKTVVGITKYLTLTFLYFTVFVSSICKLPNCF